MKKSLMVYLIVLSLSVMGCYHHRRHYEHVKIYHLSDGRYAYRHMNDDNTFMWYYLMSQSGSTNNYHYYTGSTPYSSTSIPRDVQWVPVDDKSIKVENGPELEVPNDKAINSTSQEEVQETEIQSDPSNQSQPIPAFDNEGEMTSEAVSSPSSGVSSSNSGSSSSSSTEAPTGSSSESSDSSSSSSDSGSSGGDGGGE